MSDLSHTATVDASTGDHPIHPLVNGLRQRHAKLSARDGRVRPFELRPPDCTAHSIGGGGEPAFTVRIVTEKGLAAMAAFDELAVAEALLRAQGFRAPSMSQLSRYVEKWLAGDLELADHQTPRRAAGVARRRRSADRDDSRRAPPQRHGHPPRRHLLRPRRHCHRRRSRHRHRRPRVLHHARASHELSRRGVPPLDKPSRIWTASGFQTSRQRPPGSTGRYSLCIETDSPKRADGIP